MNCTPQHDAMTDKRKSPRLRFEAATRVSDGRVETPARAVNASHDGLALRSAFLWQPGTHVTVSLWIKDAPYAVARGVIARVDGEIMGIRLTAQGPAFSRTMASLFTRRLADVPVLGRGNILGVATRTLRDLSGRDHSETASCHAKQQQNPKGQRRAARASDPTLSTR